MDDDVRPVIKKRRPDEEHSPRITSEGSNFPGELRVGKNYQATVPELVTDKSRLASTDDMSTCIWKPDPNLSDDLLVNFILAAKDKYGYSMEQSLGLLMWYKYDVENALSAMRDFMPVSEKWSSEDQVLFQQSFRYHGKHFHLIKQMLPDKSIGALVKYYYDIKKSRANPNCLDKSLLKKQMEEDEEDEPSDEEEHKDVKPQLKDFKKQLSCANCAEASDLLSVAPHGVLCQTCLNAWKKEGALPVFIRPESRASRILYSRGVPSGLLDPSRPRKCPKGIRMSDDDIRLFTGENDAGADLMQKMERRIQILTEQSVSNEQIIGSLATKLASGISMYRPAEVPRVKTTPRWSDYEMMLATQAIRRYGKDFGTIAEVIGTKTESHVKQFYLGFKDKYRLDALVKDHEEERQRERNKQTVVIQLDDEADENSS